MFRKLIAIVSQMLFPKDGWHLSFALYPMPVGTEKRTWLRLFEWKSSGTGAMDGPDWITARIPKSEISSDTPLERRVNAGPSAGPLTLNGLVKMLLYVALWAGIVSILGTSMKIAFCMTALFILALFVLWFGKKMFIPNF